MRSSGRSSPPPSWRALRSLLPLRDTSRFENLAVRRETQDLTEVP